MGLALVGFLVVSPPGCNGADPDPSADPIAGVRPAAPSERPPDDRPPDDRIEDPDEPFDAFDFALPILAFAEHSEGLPASGTWLGYPSLGDLDGDGDLDLVASNREEDGVSTWRFDPRRAWELRIEGLPREMSYGPTAIADVDSDGKRDLLVGDHTQALRAFLNDGDMSWTESSRQWVRPNILKDMAVTDLNADGFRDVVTICHFKGGLDVYLGDGQGGFRLLPEAQAMVEPKVFGRNLVLTDIDLDGTDDIAVNTNLGLKVFLTRAGEPMSWEEVSDGLPAPEIGNSLFGLTAARFDEGREAPQLAVCSVPGGPEDTNTIGVYALDAAQRSWVQVDRGLSRTSGYKDIVAADFNADGHADLLVADLDQGRVIHLGDGRGGFKAAGRIVGHPKVRFCVGDVNADGLSDVMTATSGQKGRRITGKLRVFLNDRSLW